MLTCVNSPFDVAFECCTELIEAQPARERLSYKRLLLEDMSLEPASEAADGFPKVVRGAGRSKLVEILYKDIMKKGNVDFGTIPQSRGDITRFQHYKNTAASIDALNQLVGERASDNMIRMNELHGVIIQERSAFEFGYKANIELLQYIYCTLVEALIDLVNENIVSYVDYLKETQDIELPPSLKNKASSRVDKAVDTFLSIRKKGEWRKLVDYYRREYSKRFFAEAIVIGTVSVVGIVALLWGIRSLIYTYYYSAATIDDKARSVSNFLSAVASTETDPHARRKQHKASRKLDNIATFIETKVLKDDPVVSKEIQRADAAISKAALSGIPTTPTDDGSFDIELD